MVQGCLIGRTRAPVGRVEREGNEKKNWEWGAPLAMDSHRSRAAAVPETIVRALRRRKMEHFAFACCENLASDKRDCTKVLGYMYLADTWMKPSQLPRLLASDA